MALEIYWQHHHDRTYLGGLEITAALDALLYRFSQATATLVDPYGKGRLYASQWQRLVEMAPTAGYPVKLLTDIQVHIPPDQPNGLIVFDGD